MTIAVTKQLNGFGERVGKVENTLSGNEVKTNRNTDDISKLTKMVTENAHQIAIVDRSVARLTGKVSGAVVIIMVIIEVAKTLIK